MNIIPIMFAVALVLVIGAKNVLIALILFPIILFIIAFIAVLFRN